MVKSAMKKIKAKEGRWGRTQGWFGIVNRVVLEPGKEQVSANVHQPKPLT